MNKLKNKHSFLFINHLIGNHKSLHHPPQSKISTTLANPATARQVRDPPFYPSRPNAPRHLE